MTKMHVLIYLRKSRSEDNDPNVSLDAHKRTLIELCERSGYSYEVRQEIGSSDSIKFREVFSEIYEEINTGENGYEAIVVHDYDRLSRSGRDLEEIKELFRYNGIKVITPAKVYDFDNEADDQETDFKGFMAKMEFKMIKSRLKKGKIAGAKAGRWVNGTPPYGYIYDRLNKELVIEEEKAKVVRMIFEEVLQGTAYYNIAHKLNIQGERTNKGKLWYDNTISRMIANPTYKGTAVYGKTSGSGHTSRKTTPLKIKNAQEWITVENAYPRIVLQELWGEANRVAKARRIVPHKARAELNALSGLVRCGGCGSLMRVQHRNKDGWNDYIKKCQHRDLLTNKICANRGMPLGDSIRMIFTAIREYREELFDYLRHNEGSYKEVVQLIEQLKAISKKQLECTNSIEKVNEGFDTGFYTANEAVSRKKLWEEKHTVLEEQREDLEKKLKIAESAQIEEKIEILDGILEIENLEISDEQMNKFLKSIISSITLTRAGEEPPKLVVNFL